MKKVMIITIAVLGAVLLIVLLNKLNTTRSEPSGSVGFVEEGTGAVRFTDKVSLSGISLVNGSDEGKYRIRYLSSVDKAYYDGLVRKYGAGNVKLKTIIFPLKYVTTGMTVEQLTANEKKFLEVLPLNTFAEQGDTYTFAGGINNIAESNYNLPFIGYGIIEINGGEIRYYPKEFDFEHSNLWRSAAVSVAAAGDGTGTVSLRYYVSTRASLYNSFANEFGADRVSMKIAVCSLEDIKKAGGETLEKLNQLNPQPEYSVEKCNLTLELINEVIYAFYLEVSPFLESDLGKDFCPIGVMEITDETGAVVRRIYR